MRAFLSELDFFDDAAPHPAAVNMAVDEVLLGVIRRPLLRVYRWERPAVSFGYFERWEPVRAAYPDRDAVRRWTGGGVVPHGTDFTYSVLAPRSCAGANAAPAESYRAIHGALAAALAERGIAAIAAPAASAKVSQACFENPVPHDLLVNGRKAAGAAQRRSNAGLLHQGSVQGLALPEDFGQLFAASLSESFELVRFEIGAEAEALAESKYGSREWLECVP